LAVDDFLLEILVCPETKERVKPADDDTLKRLNDLVKQGRLKNRAGSLVKERMESALVREDGRFAYPVRDDIPVMLVDEGIPLDQLP
jgi:uncharacterized protein YbaR (Trm112 family)